jgi:hypothetical protein
MNRRDFVKKGSLFLPAYFFADRLAFAQHAPVQLMIGQGASAGGGSPIALLTQAGIGGPTESTIVTAAIDTTGATLLVLAVGFYNGAHADVTISDSATNTWSTRTTYSQADYSVKIYYAENPITSATHTFTKSVNDTYGSIAVAAFSNTAVASVVDGDAGAGGAATTTQQPGSLTPGQNNSLVITALVYPPTAAGAATINSSFTVAHSQNGDAGAGNHSVALAYKVQTTAGAENPTWTSPTSGTLVAAITSFKHS